MDTLPQEVLDHIVSHLLPDGFVQSKDPYEERQKASPPLAPLATVSHGLRAAVERLTFQNVKITSHELDEFRRLFTPSRRAFLTNLIFTVILPSYDAAAAIRAESPAERAVNDHIYTEAVHSLFFTLKSWEEADHGLAASRLRLAINHPESPSDRPWPSIYAPWDRDGHDEKQCIHEGRYLHSFINLWNPEMLPSLVRIRTFSMLRPKNRYGYRNVCAKVAPILAGKMPNLVVFKVCMGDNEQRFLDIRIRNREEAAQAFRDLSLPSLHTADICFCLPRYRDERAIPPVLHDPGVDDPLSLALGHFSRELVHLELTGVFDASVLHALRDPNGESPPKLESFDVNFYAFSPSGEWYFKGQDGWTRPPSTAAALATGELRDVDHLHEESFSFTREARLAHQTPNDVFRSMADDEKLEPMIGAFAEALSGMPKLRSAMLSCELENNTVTDDEVDWFCISYFSPCRNALDSSSTVICPNCHRSQCRQLATSLLGWTPSEELSTKLRSIGERFYPGPMVEKSVITFMQEHELPPEDSE